MTKTFDYIVVGAGSAGCAVASRLSEDPNISVCLLEAGGPDKGALIHAPIAVAAMMPTKINNWAFETIPQKGLNGRKGYQPRGKTLGGSSSTNAMLSSPQRKPAGSLTPSCLSSSLPWLSHHAVVLKTPAYLSALSGPSYQQPWLLQSSCLAVQLCPSKRGRTLQPLRAQFRRKRERPLNVFVLDVSFHFSSRSPL